MNHRRLEGPLLRALTTFDPLFLLALAKDVSSTNIKLCIKIPSLQYPPPIGEGGIGIVRLSGKDALLIAQRLFPNNFEVLYSEFNSAQLILSILTCNIDK